MGTVTDVLVKLLGPEVSISSTQVSRAAEKLDAWRERPLEETPYLFLDARYERVREAGQLVDCAVPVAVGITKDGHRRVLGVFGGPVRSGSALARLQGRQADRLRRPCRPQGRPPCHPALAAPPVAFAAQRAGLCHAPRSAQTRGAAHPRDLQRPGPGPEAEPLLRQVLDAGKTDSPKLAHWAEENLPEGFTVFDLPHAPRARLRTTNGLERSNRVASSFPNTASYLRLVSALLAKCDEESMTAKIYLNLHA